MESLSPGAAAILADMILITHVVIVVFNIVMVPLAWLGFWRGWRWVRNAWPRRLHIMMMGVIALQAVVGAWCPLTVIEASLRVRAGQTVYDESFIGHWLGRLLYLDLPPWVFLMMYVGWFALTIWTWRRAGRRPEIRAVS